VACRADAAERAAYALPSVGRWRRRRRPIVTIAGTMSPTS